MAGFDCTLGCDGCPLPRGNDIHLPTAEGPVGLRTTPPPDDRPWALCVPWPSDAPPKLPTTPEFLVACVDPALQDATLIAAAAERLMQMGAEARQVLVLVPTLRILALSERAPDWSSTDGPLTTLGISHAAVAWGGAWPLDRLTVYDGFSGRRVNTFDGKGFAFVEARGVQREATSAQPDIPVPDPDDPRSPLPFMDRVRWNDGRSQLILRTTAACNQRCPHCFVDSFDEPSASDRQQALAMAAEQARSGPLELVLSGGEPLLGEALDEVLDWLDGQPDPPRIALQTNATLVARHRDRLRALAAAGGAEALVNLPSFDPGTYERMTGGTQLLGAAIEGIDALLATGWTVAANVVLTRHNIPHLVATLGEISRRWHDRVRVTVSSLSPSTPRDHLAREGLAYPDLKPVFAEAFTAARRLGLDLAIAGGDCTPPACCLPPELFHDRDWFQAAPEPVRTWHEGDPLQPGVRYKPAACAHCPHDSHCPGIPEPYAAVFGLAGIEPRSGQ